MSGAAANGYGEAVVDVDGGRGSCEDMVRFGEKGRGRLG